MGVVCQPAGDGPEGAAFPQPAPHVAGEEEDFHGDVPVFRPGALEAQADFLFGNMAQRADGCEQVQAAVPRRFQGHRSVFGMGFIGSVFDGV